MTLPAALASILLAAPLFAADLDVRKFGARGDGRAKDTAAIQRALDTAGRRGGGTVTLPPGTYLSGTLHLRSNVTLHLDNGATLLASTDNSDFDPPEALPFKSVSDDETTYFHYALVAAENVHHIAIAGHGAIDGNRTKRGGPKTVAIKLSQHVTIRGVTVRNSPNYAISLWGSDFVDIDGVTVLNSYSDGIDPDSSSYVRIANCYVDSHDDAICPKASPSMGLDRRRPVSHLTVTNCTLRTDANNFKFGTESSGDFRDIAVSNLTMAPRANGRRPVSGISLESVDGANIDGVVISNIVMEGLDTPIFIRLGNRGRGLNPARPGSVRNVSIQNVVARNSGMTSSITGLPGFPVERIAISGVTLGMLGGGPQPRSLDVPEHPAKYPQGNMFGQLPAYGLYARHVAGLSLTGLHLRWETEDLRPAMIFDDVKDLTVAGFQAGAAAGPQPLLWLNDVADALLSGIRAPAAQAFLRLTGPASRGITALANDLTRVEHPFDLTATPPSTRRTPPCPDSCLFY